MTAFEWTLNCTLLGWVLLRNLGTKPVNGRVLALPLVLVAVACAFYLRSISTAGNDLALEVAGAVAGIVLGLAATAVTQVWAKPDGRIVVSAGVAFAAIWIAAIGGRIVFAELATHAWGPAVGRFSMAHAITGADAWRTCFVLMAVCMVAARILSTAVLVRRARRAAEPLGGRQAAALTAAA
jgi:hypothetical protein